jgi:large subunit ribosomal protein L20
MPKARTGVAHLRRRNRVLKRAKGYVLGRSRLYRPARETLVRAGVYQYRDRRDFKRNIRGLWITRLNAACRERGFTYSQFLHALKAANVILNRKALSELAIADPAAFDAVVATVRKHLPAAAVN